MDSDGTVARAQAAIREIAFELLAIQEPLEAINRTLPVPPNLRAMLEDEIPPDLATDVSGCIECLTEDRLKTCIDILVRGSTITSAELDRDFLNRQKGRGRDGEG